MFYTVDKMDNIEEIATEIFGKPPGAPNSIQLQLEDATADIAVQEGVDNFVFNILCLLTFRGMEILYGHKNMLQLTEQNFDLISEYVRSYGYKIDVVGNDSIESPWELQKRGVQLRRYAISFDKIY
jgi:hypothetical protein